MVAELLSERTSLWYRTLDIDSASTSVSLGDGKKPLMVARRLIRTCPVSCPPKVESPEMRRVCTCEADADSQSVLF